MAVHNERFKLVEQLQFLCQADVPRLYSALNVEHVVLEVGVTDLHDVFRFVGFKTQLFCILYWLQLRFNVLVAYDGFDTGVVHVDN